MSPGEGTDVPSDIDTHTTAGKLQDLERRLDEAVHAGSAKAVEKQHAKGRKTARERIEILFDEGSFVELDELARHRSTAFGLEKNRPYGDGVVTGYGTIDGRQVCVFSQDFTIFGGSLGEVYGEKITKVMDLAIKTGCPIIGINEGAGARIQEGVVSLGLYGEIFRRNVHASGVIPQISLIMGNCAGGHVYSPAVTDFTIMVDQTSAMFITGPDVIKTVTGEDVTMEDLGGARTHNTKSGNAHYMGADEEDALEYVKALLSFLPQNNLDPAPTYDEVRRPGGHRPRPVARHADPRRRQPALRHARRDHRRRWTTRSSSRCSRCSPPTSWSASAGSRASSVGVVANQPLQFAGTLDIDASEKAARFVRFCDAFNIPVLTFVDVPGFLPGTDQEWDGIIRRGAKLIYAYAEATVPLVTVITRKAYGGAYDVMGSKHLGADMNVAWPTAQIAVMGAQGAVNILHRKTLAAVEKDGGGRGGEAGRADRGVRGDPRQPLHRRRARLRRRRHLPPRDPARGRQGAAAAALQARGPARQEAREHPAVMATEPDAEKPDPAVVTPDTTPEEVAALVAVVLRPRLRRAGHAAAHRVEQPLPPGPPVPLARPRRLALLRPPQHRGRGT